MNSRINFIFSHGFEIVQVQSAMHCTMCTMGIRGHISANGTVVPSMVLRYWHDRRVGNRTNQNGNGFALSTHVLLLLLRFTAYSDPTFGFATAHAYSTSSFSSGGTVVHLSIGNFAASSRIPVCCQCVSIYDSVPFPLSSGTLALVRRRTHPRDLEQLYHPTISFPLFLDP